MISRYVKLTSSTRSIFQSKRPQLSCTSYTNTPRRKPQPVCPFSTWYRQTTVNHFSSICQAYTASSKSSRVLPFLFAKHLYGANSKSATPLFIIVSNYRFFAINITSRSIKGYALKNCRGMMSWPSPVSHFFASFGHGLIVFLLAVLVHEAPFPHCRGNFQGHLPFFYVLCY